MSRAAVLAAVGLTLGYPLGAAAEHPEQPKKDRERARKGPRQSAPPAPGTRPRPLVNIYNTWTREWLAVEVDQPPAQPTIDRFLRDHFTNAPTQMEPRLIAAIMAAAKHFKSDVAIVVSGFRHPKYNLILRKKGHQVARDSQHTHGNAVDFFLPKVPTKLLHAWAKAQQLGGVGLYLTSQFVHMDTGKVRYWSGE